MVTTCPFMVQMLLACMLLNCFIYRAGESKIAYFAITSEITEDDYTSGKSCLSLGYFSEYNR